MKNFEDEDVNEFFMEKNGRISFFSKWSSNLTNTSGCFLQKTIR